MEYTSDKYSLIKDDLEIGKRYEDFVSDRLYDIGLPIHCYQSLKYQVEKGENRAGVEIKNDRRFNETGNLYFETHEKRPDATDWVESGLYRKDNTFLYFIGDYCKAWLFSKNQLKTLIRTQNFKRVETQTSKGVLIPISYFDSHPSIPLKVFNFIEDENENHIPGI